MTEKIKKTPKFLKDRYLWNETAENPYVTYALYFIMLFMSVLLIFVSVVGMCHVLGPSMNPTLSDGDYLLMTKNPTSFKHGDIITFRMKDEDGTEEALIKRVIAIGGDRIVFIKNNDAIGTVSIYRQAAGGEKFVLVQEEYTGDYPTLASSFVGGKLANNVSPDATPENMEKHALLIDADRLLVLGDHRDDSTDSRAFGLVPTDTVRGKMFYRLTKGSLLERMLLLIYNDEKL